MAIKQVDISEKDDIKFLLLVLQELELQLESNINVFSSDDGYEYEDFIRVSDEEEEYKTTYKDGTFKSKSHTLSITWRPSHDRNHPYKHVDKLYVEWKPQVGTMRMDMRYESKNSSTDYEYRVNYRVGYQHEFRNEYLGVKKLFYSIFKRVNDWYKVELPRQYRENLINSLCEAFPSILDSLLIGEQSDET